ncbi:unnamed protein product, partial [Nesidiocoris tenuis]
MDSPIWIEHCGWPLQCNRVSKNTHEIELSMYCNSFSPSQRSESYKAHEHTYRVRASSRNSVPFEPIEPNEVKPEWSCGVRTIRLRGAVTSASCDAAALNPQDECQYGHFDSRTETLVSSAQAGAAAGNNKSVLKGSGVTTLIERQRLIWISTVLSRRRGTTTHQNGWVSINTRGFNNFYTDSNQEQKSLRGRRIATGQPHFFSER